jgi:hypothetical protein
LLSGRSVKTITNNGKDVVVSNISKCKKNYAVEVIEMLEMLDVGDDKIIAYRLGGKITEEEMTSVLDIFREKIDKGKKLIVYQEVESIGGAELDAMVKKFNFFKEFGFNFSHFSKIAVITHSKWLHKIVDLEDKIFKKVEMKGFPIEEKDKAIEFLKNA